jgi:hypothetical protein
MSKHESDPKPIVGTSVYTSDGVVNVDMRPGGLQPSIIGAEITLPDGEKTTITGVGQSREMPIDPYKSGEVNAARILAHV